MIPLSKDIFRWAYMEKYCLAVSQSDWRIYSESGMMIFMFDLSTGNMTAEKLHRYKTEADSRYVALVNRSTTTNDLVTSLREETNNRLTELGEW